jgi:xanthine dehydrogenase small subunit
MIHFILNDKEVHTDSSAGKVALDFLGKDERLTGTKESCREGDCGACLVLLGSLRQGVMGYRPVTSCLLPLGELEGTHLVSIEGLNGDGLNAIQRVLVDQGAVQCGYCTPGLVVALTAFLLSAQTFSLPLALEAVGGNLCRCTGYVAIKRALSELCQRFPADCIHETDRVPKLVERGILPDYFRTIPERLRQLPRPETTAHLRGATVVAGGTDLFVQEPERLRNTPLYFLSGHEAPRGIWLTEKRCFIGATTTVEEMRASPLLRQLLPTLSEDFRLICSTPVRNRATLGGNLANASPTGDLIVYFLALDGTVALEQDGKHREIALKDFYSGYKRLAKNERELLRWLSFERPANAGGFSFEKIAKRQYLDIASVNSAMYVEIDGGLIQRMGLSAGGVAPIPLFLSHTADYLIRKPLMVSHIRAATAIAQKEISPISDARGSADYKRLLLQQLIHAHFLKQFPREIRWEDLRCN